jgi:hypothetical protein
MKRGSCRASDSARLRSEGPGTGLQAAPQVVETERPHPLIDVGEIKDLSLNLEDAECIDELLFAAAAFTGPVQFLDDGVFRGRDVELQIPDARGCAALKSGSVEC